MKPLSPAAQAAWEAFNEVAERVGVLEDYGDALAAALRAVAEQVVPHEKPTGLYCRPEFVERRMIRSQIRSIAAELEGTSPRPA